MIGAGSRQIEEAIAVARAARAAKSRTAVSIGKRAARKNRTRSRKPGRGLFRKPGPKKLIFGPGNQDQQAQIPGPGNQDYYLASSHS